MHTNGLYLFCFTRSQVTDGLPPGVIASHCGVDLLAVIEPVDMTDWVGTAAENNLRDLAWVGPRALRHDRVVRAVARCSPVFPASFGALFSSAEAVRAYADTHVDRIVGFLSYAADKEEWAVKGMIERDAVIDAISAADPRKHALAGVGGAHYLRQKQIRRDAEARLGEFLRGQHVRVASALRAIACEGRSCKPQPRAASGRDAEVAINLAFLVARGDREKFLTRVTDFADALRPLGIALAPDGPFPPYRFRPGTPPTEDVAEAC